MVLPDRYSIDNLRWASNSPQSAAYWELRNWHRRLVSTVYSESNPLVGRSNSDVMSRDWDNLLILDACRFDAFSQVNNMEGDLEPLRLNASNSSEFVQEYLSSRTHHDAVLVTGNPHSPTADDGVFHDVRFVETRTVDGRRYPGPPSDDASVVAPEDVVSETLDAHGHHPDKRLVSHFMQPHLPFLGEVGRELYTRTLSESQAADRSVFKDEQSWVALDVYKAALDDEFSVDAEDIWAAYLENLDIVLEYATELASQLNGKTAITGDHGELLGDRLLGLRYFGHPPKIRTPALNTVPWFTVDSDPRRDVTADPPQATEEATDAAREEQLAALGYK
jgi:hypothetical protein